MSKQDTSDSFFAPYAVRTTRPLWSSIVIFGEDDEDVVESVREERSEEGTVEVEVEVAEEDKEEDDDDDDEEEEGEGEGEDMRLGTR